MKAVVTDRDFAPINRGARKKWPKVGVWVLGCLLTVSMCHAASVTLNLGATAQNLTMAGTGPSSTGLGQYVVTMGACNTNGSTTTCTLSGNYTGTTPGFTDGTYSLVTTYPAASTSPLLGIEQSAGSNFFTFSSIPATATMTLNLTSSNGNLSIPVFKNGSFAAGDTFGFVYGPSATCTGTAVPSCDVADVGVTNGAVITGSVTGTATFVETSVTYYFSQLAFGGGWQTTLTLVNYSPQTVTCTTTFYSDSGAALPLPFSEGTNSSRTDALSAGQVIHDQTTSTATQSVGGWAKSTCDGPVQASILYRYYQSGTATGEAGVNAELAPTTKFATFAQTNTGVAYANPSSSATADITLTVISSAGAKLGSTVVHLGPLAHGAANVGPLLGLSSFTGFIEISSTVPIISLSLNAEAFPVFSSLPAGDLPASTTFVSP